MACEEEVHWPAREDEEVVVWLIELSSPVTRLGHSLLAAKVVSEGETQIVDGTLRSGE